MTDKNKKISLRRLIFNDKYLIITAFILALLIWTLTSLNIGTDETRTITVEVPISLGDEISEQLGMKYYTLQKSVELKVTVSGAKYIVGQVERGDLSVKFDTSNVNRAGNQSIPIIVSNKSNTLDYDVVSVYPSSLDAYYDVEESKTFDLNLSYNEDSVADGYVFGNPVLNEEKVIVSGPKTYVDKIERAFVNIPISEDTQLTETYNSECLIEIEGAGVEMNYLTVCSKVNPETVLNTVSVSIPVLKETELPVSVNLEDKPSGLPNNAVKISYSVDRISAGVLENADISKALLGTINFNKISSGTNVFDFDASKIQGIVLLDNRDKKISVTIRVDSDYEIKKIPISEKNVRIKGVPDGKTAEITELYSRTVTVIAPKDVNITAQDLELSCDVAEQSEDNSYSINVKLSNNKSWVYSTYSAKIKIN